MNLLDSSLSSSLVSVSGSKTVKHRWLTISSCLAEIVSWTWPLLNQSVNYCVSTWFSCWSLYLELPDCMFLPPGRTEEAGGRVSWQHWGCRSPAAHQTAAGRLLPAVFQHGGELCMKACTLNTDRRDTHRLLVLKIISRLQLWFVTSCILSGALLSFFKIKVQAPLKHFARPLHHINCSATLSAPFTVYWVNLQCSLLKNVFNSLFSSQSANLLSIYN